MIMPQFESDAVINEYYTIIDFISRFGGFFSLILLTMSLIGSFFIY